ncbi:MAG: DUF481 domain-containing protein [marine benthic group bacterium]|nr:DUF481 domain-containing protein [Gemmatimonadota bacterium]
MDWTERRTGSLSERCCRGLAAAAFLALLAPESLPGQKTDTVVVNNGNLIVGEIKRLQRGQLELSTDAMSTVYVEWPKIRSVGTSKIFEVFLEDGTIYFGSMELSGRDSVIVHAADDTVAVPTQSVVSLQRIKPNFWDALDGYVNFGFDFTQQNVKLDLNLNGEVRHTARQKRGSGGDIHILNSNGIVLTRFTYNASFSRQDSVANIERSQVALSRARQFESLWFWIIALGAERNSQLSLDYRWTVSGGAGRFLVQSNKFDVSVWAGPAFSRERFSGETPASSLPLVLAADAYYFTWGSLDTTISSGLQVTPILDQWGRWRVNFTLNASRDLVKNFNLTVGITESYDSAPTSADAAQNDLSITTTLGWTF